jgi:hypothetical protein
MYSCVPAVRGGVVYSGLTVAVNARLPTCAALAATAAVGTSGGNTIGLAKIADSVGPNLHREGAAVMVVVAPVAVTTFEPISSAQHTIAARCELNCQS